ncbi:hypothetical protein EJ06DRAFT_516789 [Trichodelitschia bisporula]|uniref:Cyclin domain-containing protein n=1 Tax=Trichodelitschia bisporula TaxID=703511 RepID=A0A6G1HK08_9PEZI|nr:hypothetical protein EJ06DRAFT_516789 [Trichodelitschia bisporula]
MSPHASHLTNPLATPTQLSTSGSQLDGIPPDLERSIIFAGARLTQTAGQLLRLPQDIIARAIILFTRFWVGSEGGSLREYAAADISAAALYLTSKLSPHPQQPRSIVNAYAYLDSFPTTFNPPSAFASHTNQESYFLSEAACSASKLRLMQSEAIVLRVLGFNTHVATPYTLCINYLQALDVFPGPRATAIARRAFAYLNAALLSPQLVYLTHQPHALAVAAIYLAAREGGVKLPDGEWWAVFDVEREELGFLVVALRSLEGFVRGEREAWGGRRVPLSLGEVEAELERRGVLERVE